MNLKINKDQADFILNGYKQKQYLIGSHMYGTQKENSDKDYLVVYKSFHENADFYYPNFHQFQWDDVDNNTQYVFSSERQFWKNLFSGDSTINADVIFFADDTYSVEEKLNITRTFNIIKAFIGFAKRDMKLLNKGKNKLFHINRGLYCAECLLDNRLPVLDGFNFTESSLENLSKREAELRAITNNLLEKNELTLFPKQAMMQSENELENMLVASNNIKAFYY